MPEPSVQSVARAFHILEMLAHAKRPAALQEISGALGLSKSTVHRLLGCLVELGYAEHLPGGVTARRRNWPHWRQARTLPRTTICVLCRPARL